MKTYIVRVEYETRFSRDVQVRADDENEAREIALERCEEEVDADAMVAWDEDINATLSVRRVREAGTHG